MSFRKHAKKITMIRLADNSEGASVSPRKGTNSLFWWWKGDDRDGWWVKADLYDVDGDNIECITMDSLPALKDYLRDAYGLSVMGEAS